MNQHLEWTTDTFKVFQKSSNNSNSSSNNNSNHSSSHTSNDFNLGAKSYIPPAHAFDPFAEPSSLGDNNTDVDDLSQHLISSHLLDDDDQPHTTSTTLHVWDPQQEWQPCTDKADIWSPGNGKEEKKGTPTNTSSSSNREDDDEAFDPTLQFYHGTLYDSHTIQDMNRLALNVTNPSLEETEAEGLEQDMSTLQMMQTIFSDLSDEALLETLARHDYDVDRAIESLLSQASVMTTTMETQTAVPSVKKRQVCRHFLAGECYRKDCWFVHDLQEKVCKFWLQGTCFKGDSCEFSHHIDVQEVANKMIPPVIPSPKQPQFTPTDYPQLSSTTTMAKKAPSSSSLVPSVKPCDEFPSLAFASKIKKAPNAIKGGHSINFAEALKKKGSAKKGQQQAVKKVGARRGPGYSNLQKLTQPVHIPWLDTGSTLNSVYMKEREQAIEYGMLRNRFFSRATEYYLKGDGAKARLYSMEAKRYNRMMQEMHTEASQRIFESRSQHEAFVDLHGLHEDEAIRMIEQRLGEMKSQYGGIIYIVTGTGHHSGANGLSKRQSKLKPTVQAYLKSEHYRFAETSMVGDNKGGIFAVDLSL
ncbi:hypothetical protein INT47_010288 [Mucor saturninus]|uniref:Uncharacterized protein n=1 Tax=Mucor saturninus TaxID=64648 RepID=A0A8H7QW75_9FUNG|nr:hypothetical protein INT47_010288 [Mucor saturninus]